MCTVGSRSNGGTLYIRAKQAISAHAQTVKDLENTNKHDKVVYAAAKRMFCASLNNTAHGRRALQIPQIKLELKEAGLCVGVGD